MAWLFLIRKISTGLTLVPLLAWPAWALPAPWHWQTIVGIGFPYESPVETSWEAIGDRFGLSPKRLAAANGAHWQDPLPAGRSVWISDQRIIPGRPGSGALINVPEGRLDIVLDGLHAGSWPVAVGNADWPTPLGRFALGKPLWQPAWHVPASIRAKAARQGRPLPAWVPPGPANPLGEVWMPLGDSGVGLHGTPADTRWVDLQDSHGCLRLAPDHAQAVAALWRPGMTVDVVYERAKVCRFNGGTYLEVHPDPYLRAPRPPAALGSGSVLRWLWQSACGVPLLLD